MSKFGNVLKGVAGVGLSVLGLVGAQPGLVVAGVGLVSSVLNPGTTTQVKAVAAATHSGLSAYSRTVSAQKGQVRVGTSEFPKWVMYVGIGAVLLFILKRYAH